MQAAPSIFVLGGGAVGSVIAHQLRAAGCDITLLMRNPDVKQAKITLENAKTGKTDTQVMSVQRSSSEGPIIEHLIVATKAFDIAPALLSLQPRLAQHSGVVVIHNGLLTTPWSNFLPNVSQLNIFSGVSMGGSHVLKSLPDAHTRWAAPAPLFLGPIGNTPEPSSPACQQLLQALSSCESLQARAVPFDEIWKIQRLKLSVNAVCNGVSALMNASNGMIAAASSFAQLARNLCEETASVYAEEARSLDKKPDPDLDAESLSKRAVAMMEMTGPNYSSTLQDIRNGRRTEIAYINGAIADLGRRYGVSTVRHDLIGHLVNLRSALGSDSFKF